MFIYSEKASTFCEISTLLLSYVVPVKSKVDISQKFVAFSEYMNFTTLQMYETWEGCHFETIDSTATTENRQFSRFLKLPVW